MALCKAAALVFLASAIVAGQEAERLGAAGTNQPGAAHQATPEELPLRGVAHVGIQVSDLQESRTFYHDVLGFEEVFDLRAPESQDVAIAFFKINDRQYIEIFPGLRPEQPAPIRYLAMETDDIARLHAMLQTRGVALGAIGKSREGNLKFSITNPAGLELSSLDFVQYMPASLHSAALGKGLGTRRIGASVNHVGLVASDLGSGKKFFVQTLGFREGHAKKRTDGTIYAVHLGLPGASGEYLELSARPSQFDRHQGGVKTHLCLGVADPAAAYQEAVKRGAKLEPVQSPRGKQEKFPFLLFDPDHSRIEFQSAKTTK